MSTPDKNFRAILWIVVSLAAAALLFSPDQPFAAEHVIIGTPSRGLFEFPVVIAMHKGFYRAEGIDVDTNGFSTWAMSSSFPSPASR